MSGSQSEGLDSARGWLVVGGGFLACFVVFGVLYSFGVFLKPMSAQFGVTHAVMSTLFSCMSVLSYLLGPFTGDLADHIGSRKMVLGGAVAMTAGLLATPRAGSFAVAFVCLGVGIGAGLAATFVPTMATVGEWFQEKRDLALGIAISGIGAGTLAAAPVAAALIQRYGWQRTMTIFGIVAGILLVVSALLMAEPPVKVERKGSTREVWQKVCTSRFLLMYVSFVLAAIAIMIAMVYLPALAMSEGINRVAAAALVGYVGGASIISRIGLDGLAEKFGIMRVYQLSFVFVCVACAVWMYAHSHAGLAVFAVVLGIGYGGVAALTPAVAAHMFGLASFGELLGVLVTAYGAASVIGPPFAGYLVDRSGSYRDVVWFALLCSAIGVASVFAIRKDAVAIEEQKSERAAA